MKHAAAGFDKKNVEPMMTVFVFVFLFFMMTCHLTHSALWADEWVEYNVSRASIANGDLYRNVIRTYQPPLYNVVMHFWLKINDSILWFRFFNVVLGMISGIFLCESLRILYHRTAANIAVILLAVSYQWIFCIQECSEYALMLMFCFGAILYFIKAVKTPSWFHTILFIFMCVGAMYSQYGSFFVVVPLLILYFIWICKEKNVKRIWMVTGMYFMSLLLFALPLYYFYARIQLLNNEIGDHTLSLSTAALSVKEFLTTPGLMIRYLWNIGSDDVITVFFQIVSLVLLILSVIVLTQKKAEKEKRSLIVTLLAAYMIHYVLVKLHIYAMIHPGESAGFFGRYSYFYIPLLTVAVPVILLEFLSMIKNPKWKNVICGITGMMLLLTIVISFPKIMKNWNKSYDDQFAQIWIDEKGYEDTTFLLGTAGYGFYYYIGNEWDTGNVYDESAIDPENLPERFWLWRTNWGGEGYASTLSAAEEQGYHVNVYMDYGSSGQLAFCFK